MALDREWFGGFFIKYCVGYSFDLERFIDVLSFDKVDQFDVGGFHCW